MTLTYILMDLIDVMIIILCFSQAIVFFEAFKKIILNKALSKIETPVWILVICLAPFFGPLGYLFFDWRDRKNKDKHDAESWGYEVDL